MTAYDGTPNAFVQQLISGQPGYAFGSLRTGPPCRMVITRDSVSSNVVTLTVKITEGFIPTVGDLIYTYATLNSAGGLNQTTGIAIASVNITAATGIGTITYPFTIANQGATADVGYAIAVPGETAEVPGGTEASRAFAIQNSIGRGYGISWAYTCPSAPGAISIQLEGAISNQSTEFTIIGSAVTTTTGYNETFATLPSS